jgi:ABC-2 type transport system ATP-binding protein
VTSDYLQFVAALKGVPATKAQGQIETLAHNVGLLDDLNRRCVTYSGGMQRRLGIAQALLDEPEILISRINKKQQAQTLRLIAACPV